MIFFACMMSLSMASLNSGSNGNCYYIGNHNDAVFIDAGLTFRETVKRMERLGLSFDLIKAIFISHEHTDHISGAAVISKRFRIPVYISEHAYKNSKLHISSDLLVYLKPEDTIQVGNLSVKAFSKMHDAAEPFSFTVSGEGKTVGVFTDIGSITEEVIQNFSICHAAFLEANYDEEMLIGGRYPWFLKNRIRGDRGHLSNMQALDLFTKYRSPRLSHLLLSHLSRDNNSPDLVLDMFRKHSGQIHISIASRYRESPLYFLS